MTHRLYSVVLTSQIFYHVSVNAEMVTHSLPQVLITNHLRSVSTSMNAVAHTSALKTLVASTGMVDTIVSACPAMKATVTTVSAFINIMRRQLPITLRFHHAETVQRTLTAWKVSVSVVKVSLVMATIVE